MDPFDQRKPNMKFYVVITRYIVCVTVLKYDFSPPQKYDNLPPISFRGGKEPYQTVQ